MVSPIRDDIVFFETVQRYDMDKTEVVEHLRHLIKCTPISSADVNKLRPYLEKITSWVKDEDSTDAKTIRNLASSILKPISAKPVQQEPKPGLVEPSKTSFKLSHIGPREEYLYFGTTEESPRSLLLAMSQTSESPPGDLEKWVTALSERRESIIDENVRECDKAFWNFIKDLPEETQDYLMALYPSSESVIDKIPEKMLSQISEKLGAKLLPTEIRNIQSIIEKSNMKQTLAVLQKSLGNNLNAEMQKSIAEFSEALRQPHLHFKKMGSLAEKLATETYKLVEHLPENQVSESRKQALENELFIPLIEEARKLDEQLLPALRSFKEALKEKITDIFVLPNDARDVPLENTLKVAEQLPAPDATKVQMLVEKSKLKEQINVLEKSLGEAFGKEVPRGALQSIQSLRLALNNPLATLHEFSAYVSTLEEAVQFSKPFEDLDAEYSENIASFVDKLDELKNIPPELEEEFLSIKNRLDNSDITFEELQAIQKDLLPLLVKIPRESSDADNIQEDLRIAFEQVLHGKNFQKGPHEILAVLDTISGSAKELDRTLQKLYVQSPEIQNYRNDVKEAVKKHYFPKEEVEPNQFWQFLSNLPLHLRETLFVEMRNTKSREVPMGVLKALANEAHTKGMLTRPPVQDERALQEIIESSGFEQMLESLSLKLDLLLPGISKELQTDIQRIREALQNPLLNFYEIDALLFDLHLAVEASPQQEGNNTIYPFKRLSEDKKFELLDLFKSLESVAKMIDRNMKGQLQRSSLKNYRENFQKIISGLFQSANEPQNFDLESARQIQTRIEKSNQYIRQAKSDLETVEMLEKKGKRGLSALYTLIEKNPSIPLHTKENIRVRKDSAKERAEIDEIYEYVKKALEPSFIGLHRTLFSESGDRLDAFTQQFIEQQKQGKKDVSLKDYEKVQNAILREEILFDGKPYWALNAG